MFVCLCVCVFVCLCVCVLCMFSLTYCDTVTFYLYICDDGNDTMIYDL